MRPNLSWPKLGSERRRPRKTWLRTRFGWQTSRLDSRPLRTRPGSSDQKTQNWSVDCFHFSELLNVENESEMEEGIAVEGPLQEVTIEEVQLALKSMKPNKATDP